MNTNLKILYYHNCDNIHPICLDYFSTSHNRKFDEDPNQAIWVLQFLDRTQMRTKEPKTLEKLIPNAPKSWLYILAFLMWSGVGIYLCSLTIDWLKPEQTGARLLFIGGGIILAFAIAIFGFSQFANKNIARISVIPKEKVCIFAFQAWTSYPLVIFMISLGIFLRKYSPVPKTWLSTMYIGIGGSLFLASFLYLKQIFIRNHHG